MTVFRAIFAALIVLGCALVSQACVIESLLPEAVCCCEGDAPPAHGEDETCLLCATVERSASHRSIERFVAAAPVFVEELMLAVAFHDAEPSGELLGGQMDRAAESPPPIWQLVARTSAPVRGPSFAA